MRDALAYELVVAFLGFVFGVLVTLLTLPWLEDRRPESSWNALEDPLEDPLERPLQHHHVGPFAPYDWERDL